LQKVLQFAAPDRRRCNARNLPAGENSGRQRVFGIHGHPAHGVHWNPSARLRSIHPFLRFGSASRLEGEDVTMARSTHVNRVDRLNSPGLDHPSDEQLFEQFRDGGDPAAFEVLVHRYEQELFGFLRRYLGDAQLAEDVFQSTFLRVYQACDRFETGRRFRPWLYTIATHQAIDAQRRARRHRLSVHGRRADHEAGISLEEMAVAPGRGAGARLEDEETRAWVRTAVDRLPEPQRRVVSLVYEHGVKQHDVARILGVPVGTVKSRMHAAMRKLSASWHDDQPRALVATAAAH
jgi:RNA polymerase sigma-70 factor (ECF subfamily)